MSDHKITYIYNAGREECRIDGEDIETFFEKNSSVHEHIRRNILLATRNFQFRVQTFIKTVVHNRMSELRVKYHSFRTEFQMRGKVSVTVTVYSVMICLTINLLFLQVLHTFMVSYSWT